MPVIILISGDIASAFIGVWETAQVTVMEIHSHI